MVKSKKDNGCVGAVFMLYFLIEHSAETQSIFTDKDCWKLSCKGRRIKSKVKSQNGFSTVAATLLNIAVNITFISRPVLVNVLLRVKIKLGQKGCGRL
jgi:hypothetical protein